MTKTCWNHFEMSLLTPSLTKKYTIFLELLFLILIQCTVTSVLGLSVDLRKVTYNLKVP